jgi:hypothetical protein
VTIINEFHEEFDKYCQSQENAHKKIDDCLGYLLITYNPDGTQTICRDTLRLNHKQASDLYGFAFEKLEEHYN